MGYPNIPLVHHVPQLYIYIQLYIYTYIYIYILYIIIYIWPSGVFKPPIWIDVAQTYQHYQAVQAMASVNGVRSMARDVRWDFGDLVEISLVLQVLARDAFASGMRW